MTAGTSERRAGFEVRRGIQEYLPLSARRAPNAVCMELPDGTRANSRDLTQPAIGAMFANPAAAEPAK